MHILKFKYKAVYGQEKELFTASEKANMQEAKDSNCNYKG